jgi:hypothetical protein
LGGGESLWGVEITVEGPPEKIITSKKSRMVPFLKLALAK